MQFVGGSYEEESTQHLLFSTTTIEATNGPYQGRREKRSHKRAFHEMDLSEWGITLKEFCPRKGKQSDDSGKKPRQ
jgi:hypothetical protein